MALFGSVETVRTQCPGTPGFTTAFAYVAEIMQADSPARKRLAALAAGESARVELGGGVFAIEQAYQPKQRADAFFESHQAHIDLQVLVEGGELMEVVDASRARVRTPYDASRDLTVYEDAPGASQLRLDAGEAAVFFPADVHMPSLRPGSQAGVVRKTVVKIPVA